MSEENAQPEGVPEVADLYRQAGREALEALISEYERRLNAGVAEHGPNFAHEVEHLVVDLAGGEEQTNIRFSISPEDRERAAFDIAWRMEKRFGDPEASEDAPEEALVLEGFDAHEEGEEDAARALARRYTGEVKKLPGRRLEEMVGLGGSRKAVAVPRPQQVDAHYHTAAPLVWQRLREAVAQGAFSRGEDADWPVADITAPSRKVRGLAEMKPRRFDNVPYVPPEDVRAWANLMWRHSQALSDLDADMLDALTAIWLSQVRDPRDSALATVDDLLFMRGIKPRPGGSGDYRGGYTPAQRASVVQSLTHLENIWLTISEMEVYKPPPGKKKAQRQKMSAQSRAFVVTDRVGQMRLDGTLDVNWFRFRPGDIFGHFLGGPGRQVALLSAAALAYDPYREALEKRLAKYLSWIWKTSGGDHHQPHKVSTLLERAGQEVEAKNPQRTRERLERALDRLHSDGVVAEWEYERFCDPLSKPRQGWVSEWLASTVAIEPPDIVKEAYPVDREAPPPLQQAASFMGDDPHAMLAALKAQDMLDPTVARAKKRRKELGISQRRLAEKLVISQGVIGLTETARHKTSRKFREKLEAWLSEVGEPEPLTEEEKQRHSRR